MTCEVEMQCKLTAAYQCMSEVIGILNNEGDALQQVSNYSLYDPRCAGGSPAFLLRVKNVVVVSTNFNFFMVGRG